MRRTRPSVVSLHVGAVRELAYRGGTIPSGVRKSPLAGVCELSEFGLAGNEQADLVNHGGHDKALCTYPEEHYSYWSNRLRRTVPRPWFGENLTLRGLTESQACIGDVYELGTALVQVSQPRQPCYKLAAFHDMSKLALWVQESGYTGFYFRVLRAGHVAAGMELSLQERPHPRLTVSEANRVMHHDKRDRAGLQRLLVPELAERWRDTFQKRLSGTASEAGLARLRGT